MSNERPLYSITEIINRYFSQTSLTAHKVNQILLKCKDIYKVGSQFYLDGQLEGNGLTGYRHYYVHGYRYNDLEWTKKGMLILKAFLNELIRKGEIK